MPSPFDENSAIEIGHVELVPFAGTHIDDALRGAVIEALKLGKVCHMTFNNVRYEIEPWTILSDMRSRGKALPQGGGK